LPRADAGALRAKHVVNLDELPMSPLGKVMLPRLKAIVAGKKGS
jgi:hypothetical protein